MRVRARECKPYGGQCGGRAALMKANACRRPAEMVLNFAEFMNCTGPYNGNYYSITLLAQ